ncbi:hypothetical protein [Winogradskyella aurantia]|uniref:DUF3575 domain-containing protein n=1 Tax=Winogradskyella aurantia TaxID=1915063 RepID=A0A265UZ96_9FLAO|nr:hypothetical protein [Winogradskyella aurantia]OZV70633.1 hypothetical protein CA834_00525 [Winogradskyella aurantia]
MKNTFLAFLLSISSIVAIAQDQAEESISIFDRKHEVRLGSIKLLSGFIFEGAYEYIINSNQGIGAYALINLDKSNDWFENYSLTPYYRMYFQTNEDYGAKGFFIEGFGSFFLTDFDLEDAINNSDNEEVFDISIGLALGKKWINTSGFVFEIKIGAGRNLLGNADFDAMIKGDFYIGYRF